VAAPSEPSASPEPGSSSPIRPLFLLADSQLLFFREPAEGSPLLLDRVREDLGPAPVRAAYLGASNGDEPAYYDIFVAAMEGIGVRDCRMIPSAPSAADRAFVEQAGLVLLAGGDAARGLAVLRESGLADLVVARYAAGAVLVGVSAGAVQLGLRLPGTAVDGLRLAPLGIAAHDEPEWAALAAAVTALGGAARGIGIPLGGGAVMHADLSVEPVRRALVEISLGGDAEGAEDVAGGERGERALRRALLMPP
jgi:cyanophycinase